jgi:hypothetical protein
MKSMLYKRNPALKRHCWVKFPNDEVTSWWAVSGRVFFGSISAADRNFLGGRCVPIGEVPRSELNGSYLEAAIRI